MKTLGDLRDLGDLQFEEICWNWNCCRFTWQVFEESPESYLSPSRGAVWGYLGGQFDVTEPLGFVQDARDVMVMFEEWLAVLGSVGFVCWTIPLQDDTPVCHDCLLVNGTSKFIMNISSRHGC